MKINYKLLKKYANLAAEVSGDTDLAWKILLKERDTQSKAKEFIADTLEILYKETYEDMPEACDLLGYHCMAAMEEV
jgi:hypothetical protein